MSMTLHRATRDEAKDVYAIFRAYPHIFPHMRYDKLCRMIEAQQCIWHDGVVVTYQRYRRTVRLGTILVPSGTTCLHQIAKAPTAEPGAASRVYTAFYAAAVPEALVLTVRADNAPAWAFYERHGLQRIGEIHWTQQGQPLPGYVYASTIFPSTQTRIIGPFDGEQPHAAHV